LKAAAAVLGVAVAALPAAGAERPGTLPDGVVVAGQRDVAFAWLTGPTHRYAHGVLGDAIEASGLAVEMADGRQLTFELDAGSVFEDRYPRLHDLDGDGDDEILAVRSYLDRGAALAVLGVEGGRLAILAETPAIGTANRWLNPVGAADFDGNGVTEIALVRTPHIGGTLALYRWQDGHLTEAHRAEGFSNHAIGTRELALSAVIDANGDGIPDLAVPGADRRTLRIVTFAHGRFQELANVPHAAPIASAIVPRDDESGRRLTYTLADGSRQETPLVGLPR
jgi:hypothetical protein